MKARFITFKAKQGDCIFLILSGAKKRCHVMIDCGEYNDEIKAFVEGELQKHIDFLIVTHIDNDHIDGIVDMLKATPDLTIGKVFYNCNQLWNGQTSKPMSEIMKKDAEVLRKKLPPKRTLQNGKIKADQATTLAEALASNKVWWNAWQKDNYITIKSAPIPLGEGFGLLRVLSPTKEGIEKLNKKFKVEYERLNKHILEVGEHVEGQEMLFELVARVAAMKQVNYQVAPSVKTGTVTSLWTEKQLENAYAFEPQSVTEENTASIALLWEGNKKRILLMGDAEPKIVCDNIEHPIDVELVKVSHHGSKHSTSVGMIDKVKSCHYFFTGGNLSDKPSLEALLKIVNRGDGLMRTLYFNNTDNAIVKKLLSEEGKAFQKQYNFVIASKNEYEFEY